MYDFFMTFINNASNLVDLGIGREIIEPVVSKENSMIEKKNTSSREMEILSQEYGCLEKGMRLEIDLNRILEILPRTRRKADAYKGLRAELKKHGVELVITSTRHSKTKIV